MWVESGRESNHAACGGRWFDPRCAHSPNLQYVRGVDHDRLAARRQALYAFVIDRLTERPEIADVNTSVVYEHLRNFVIQPLDVS